MSDDAAFWALEWSRVATRLAQVVMGSTALGLAADREESKDALEVFRATLDRYEASTW